MFRYVHGQTDLKIKALEAACQILDGITPAIEEKYLSLAQCASALGYLSYQSLWRLEAYRVAETYGGRRRYKLSAVNDYLNSDQCSQVRAKLAEKRRSEENARKQKAAEADLAVQEAIRVEVAKREERRRDEIATDNARMIEKTMRDAGLL